MQTAFGSFNMHYDQKPIMPFSGLCFGSEAAAGALQQQAHPPQHMQPGMYSSVAMMQPVTPLAGQEEATELLWQTALANIGGQEASEDGDKGAAYVKEPKAKQRKGPSKAKKGSGRRDLDKLAKQEQRMIKNRESAARSRLRRQQHTAELEQENEALRSEVAALKEQIQQLQNQVVDMDWQLQLNKVPANMPRASISTSHPQHTAGGISQLPPAPSLSLSLPHASSLMLPTGPLGGLGPLAPQHEPTIGADAAVQQDGLGMDGFDFAYASRRGSSYA